MPLPISRSLWAAAGTAVLALGYPAQALAQQVDAAASELTFVTRVMGAPVEGRLVRWDATLQFDPKQVAQTTLSMRIDMTSVRFAAAEVSAEAQRPVWFDTARFAEAQFRSSELRPLGNGRYELAGALTLKGRTRDLVVPLTLEQAGSSGIARGALTLSRLDFGIGEGEWADAGLVAHDVAVRFRIALKGLAAPGAP